MINKKLQNCFKLGSRITIYVPSTININEEIDNTQYVDNTLKLFSECFGGATSSNALGSWISPTMGLTKEKTTICFAFCTSEQLEKHIDIVIEYCEAMKSELKQDAIALEINGEMYFI